MNILYIANLVKDIQYYDIQFCVVCEIKTRSLPVHLQAEHVFVTSQLHYIQRTGR